MATRNFRIMHCSVEDVFSVLADGWLFPVWVVGAARMRDVDPTWPEPGSEIHHSLGVWPVLVDDETEVVRWDPPNRLKLRARASFLGRGIIVIDVHKRGENACIVRMGEEPVSGLAAVLPRFMWAPLLSPRNRETLRRLAFLAEGRRREREIAEAHADSGIPEAPNLALRPEGPGPLEGDPSEGAVADAIAAEGAREAASTPVTPDELAEEGIPPVDGARSE